MSLDLFSRDQRDLLDIAAANPVPDLAPSFAQAFEAATREAREFSNSTAESRNRWETWQRALDVFELESGEALANPAALPPGPGQDALSRNIRRRIDEYRAGNPESKATAPTEEDLTGGAIDIARAARSARASVDRRPQTFFSQAGGFFGDLVGAVSDPVNAASMGLGAPAAAGILRTALVEAGIGIGSQAAIEVATASFKQDVDPSYGVGEAAGNVAMAGVGGAVLGGGIKALEVGAKRLFSRRPPTSSERDALAVLEREASIDETSPFPDAGVVGEVAHRQALDQAAQALEAGRAPSATALTAEAAQAQRDGAAARRRAFESDRQYELGKITAEERAAAWRDAGMEPQPMLVRPHELVAFAEEARAVAGRKVAARIATVDDAQAELVLARTDLDVAGYRHEIDNSGVRHALKHHGDPVAEARRGQVAITPDDFARIPEVLRNPDEVTRAGKNDAGRDLLRFEKTFADGTVYYVEELRTGKKTLAFQTMWKRGTGPGGGDGAATPDAAPSREAPPRLTSETIAASGQDASSAATGQVARVFTAAGTPVQVRYRVVEADSLITSNTGDGAVNPAYPADLQPRDRTRVASQTQIAEMAGRLEPERLGLSPDAGGGAPIIGPDLVVESGNGRTLAIRAAYDQGGESAARYRSWLEGEYPESANMQRPVLVAERVTEMTPEARRAFTAEANQATAARMSPAELARADARLLDDAMMGTLRGSDVMAAGNRPFVRAFLDRLPTTERGELVDADGALNQAGRRRVEGAVLAKAYDDPKLLGRLIEDADSNIKAIGGALADSAAPWARMRAAAERGELASGMDITDDLLAAVRTVIQARASGRNIRELAQQEDMFGGGLTDIARLLLQTMFRDPDLSKPAGRARMAEALSAYAEEAMKNTAGPRLIGDALTADEIARNVVPPGLRPAPRAVKPADLTPTNPRAPGDVRSAAETDAATFQDLNRLMREKLDLEVTIGIARDERSKRDVAIRARADDLMAEADRGIAEAKELAACAFGIAAE